MANVTEINAVTQDFFLPALSINFGSQNVILKMLKGKGKKLDGGPLIEKSLAYQYTKGGAFGRNQILDVSGEQNIDAMKLPFKYYYWPTNIPIQDQLENMGSTRVIDIMEAKMQIINFGGTEMLASHLLNGYITGGAGIDSSLTVNHLDHALDNTSGTLTTLTVGAAKTVYGQIDKSTSTWFGGNVADAGGASHGPTFNNLMKAYTLAHDGEIRPNLGLGNGITVDTYMKSQQPLQQYITEGTTKDMTAGFMRAAFMGIPVVADNHVPQETTVGTGKKGRLYFLNTDYFEFITHENADFKLKDGTWVQPFDQASLVATVIWAGNFYTWDPRRHAVLYDIDCDATAD